MQKRDWTSGNWQDDGIELDKAKAEIERLATEYNQVCSILREREDIITRLRAALKELINPTVPPQLGDSIRNMVVPLAAWENAKSICEQ